MKEQSLVELLAVAGRTNRTTFRDQVLRPLLDAGLVEMTLPEKPTSGKQRYRATARGVHGWMRGRDRLPDGVVMATGNAQEPVRDGAG